jgi:hypothetical protein
MGTPRLSKPVNQIRNVQRTASRGGANAGNESLETNCAFNQRLRGKFSAALVTGVALNPNPASLLGNNCESGAVFPVELAQHDLLAQQRGLHALCTGASETMHVRADEQTGATIREMTIMMEIAIRLSINI